MSKIHPTAILSGTIDLADDVEIGPYCVLSGEIRIGAGSVLIANVHVHGPMIMGSANVCYPGVNLGFAPQDRSFAPTKLGSGAIRAS